MPWIYAPTRALSDGLSMSNIYAGVVLLEIFWSVLR